MTEPSDRFVPAPRDPTGALVTAVGYETECAAPRDHRGLPSPFLTFIVTLDTPVVIAEGGGERGLDVVVAGLSTEVETVKMPSSARRGSRRPSIRWPRGGSSGCRRARWRGCRWRARTCSGGPRRACASGSPRRTDWDERFAIFASEMGSEATASAASSAVDHVGRGSRSTLVRYRT